MENIKINKIIVVVIMFVLAVVIWNLLGNRASNEESVAQKVLDSGEIRICYMIYSPLTTKDAQTGKLGGIFYDLTEDVAKKLNIKTNWAEEVGPGTAVESLKTRKCDMFATGMWPNSSRAREAIFSKAAFYHNVYAYTRPNEQRIKPDLSNLNSDKFIISLIDGEIPTFIVKEEFPNSKTLTLPQMSSYAEAYQNVITSKADIIFADQAATNDFLRNNPGKLKRLSDSPLRSYGNTFAFARGEDEIRDMWDVALQELINERKVEKVLEKYGVKENYVLNK